MITRNYVHQEYKLVSFIDVHSGLYPSCLQTTRAAFLSQLLSSTVLHSPFMHTSTRPSLESEPLMSRTSLLLLQLTVPIVVREQV